MLDSTKSRLNNPEKVKNRLEKTKIKIFTDETRKNGFLRGKRAKKLHLFIYEEKSMEERYGFERERERLSVSGILNLIDGRIGELCENCL